MSIDTERGITRVIRRLANALRDTPLHPQWFSFRGQKTYLQQVCAGKKGTVVDIGCAEGTLRGYLDTDADYYGLDYYDTATNWYHTNPDLFGDAQALPFADLSVDHIFLMDVMEHLPEPEACLQEIFRVLRKNGTLVLATPFLYPIHDAPLDFRRWTVHGLEHLASRHGYRIESLSPDGRAIETAALLTNIALTRLVLALTQSFWPLGLLWLPLTLLVPVINTTAFILGRLDQPDAFMAHGYRAQLTKP